MPVTAGPRRGRNRPPRAEVGIDDRGIVPDLIWSPVGDPAPEVQHHDPVRDVHDHVDAVVDDHHGEALLLVDVEDEAGHRLLLLGVHPRRRLVQEEQVRIERQGARHLHEPLVPVGQVPHHGAPERLQVHEVDDLLHILAVLDLPLALAAPVEAAAEHAAVHVHVAAQHQVVEHRQVLEELDVLEGARDAMRRDAVRGEPVERVPRPVAPGQGDASRLRAVEAGDAVQDTRLAGPVGTDEGQQLAAPHLHGETGERGHAPEAEAEVRQFEDAARQPLPTGAMPVDRPVAPRQCFRPRARPPDIAVSAGPGSPASSLPSGPGQSGSGRRDPGGAAAVPPPAQRGRKSKAGG